MLIIHIRKALACFKFIESFYIEDLIQICQSLCLSKSIYTIVQVQPIACTILIVIASHYQPKNELAVFKILGGQIKGQVYFIFQFFVRYEECFIE